MNITWKRIDEIEEGDIVLGHNKFTNEILGSDVRKLYKFSNKYDDCYVINRNIVVSPTHPFWVNGGYNKSSGEIELGDELRNIDNNDMTVESIEKIDGKEVPYIYNMSVYNTQSYFVQCDNGEALVHNMGNIPIKGGRWQGDDEMVEQYISSIDTAIGAYDIQKAGTKELYGLAKEKADITARGEVTTAQDTVRQAVAQTKRDRDVELAGRNLATATDFRAERAVEDQLKSLANEIQIKQETTGIEKEEAAIELELELKSQAVGVETAITGLHTKLIDEDTTWGYAISEETPFMTNEDNVRESYPRGESAWRSAHGTGYNKVTCFAPFVKVAVITNEVKNG